MKRSELDALRVSAMKASEAYNRALDECQRIRIGGAAFGVRVEVDAELGVMEASVVRLTGDTPTLEQAQMLVHVIRIVERWNANEADSSELPESEHLVKR